MDEVSLIALLESIGIRGIVRRNNNLMAQCPYHTEHDPSWGISLEEPHLHGCFACQAKGSLVTLLRQIGGYSAEEANRFQVEQQYRGKHRLPEFSAKDSPMQELDSRALLIFDSSNAIAAQYLRRRRGLTTKAIYSGKIMYDPFQRRVLFLWYYEDKFVGLTGRALDDSNPVKTLPYFGTLKGQCLFLPEGKISNKTPLVLVEGEIDAWKVWCSGWRNVGGLGFGRFTKEHCRLIVENGVKDVICFFDDDHTGELLERNVKKLLQRVRVHRVSYAGIRDKYSEKIDPGFLPISEIEKLLFSDALEKNIVWVDL